MPKPYSYDFRQKVLQALELDGLKKQEASELFNISRNTIKEVVAALSQKREMFRHCPIAPQATTIKSQTGSSFERLLSSYGDKTQVEMAQLWEGDISDPEGICFAARTISRSLKKIGPGRKKRPKATSNEMSRNGKPL